MQLKSKDVSETAPWESHDTLLLDMDGTILDLAFDDYFWRELVPRCFSRQHGVSAKEAEAQAVSVRSRARGDEGTQPFADYLTRLQDEIATRALPDKSSK